MTLNGEMAFIFALAYFTEIGIWSQLRLGG